MKHSVYYGVGEPSGNVVMNDGCGASRLTEDARVRMRGERDLLTVLCVQTEIDEGRDKKRRTDGERQPESEKVERWRVRPGK